MSADEAWHLIEEHRRLRDERLTELLGSEEEIDDLLDNLPCSDIPDRYDVLDVVEWFIDHGWNR